MTTRQTSLDLELELRRSNATAEREFTQKLQPEPVRGRE